MNDTKPQKRIPPLTIDGRVRSDFSAPLSLSGVVTATAFDRALQHRAKDHSESIELLVDFKDAVYVDISALISVTALFLSRKRRGLRTFIGVSAAAERLLADGSLNELVASRDERVRAGDQEDSGFAQSAAAHETQWLIFRGVSDLGDPEKSDAPHFGAATAAAATSVAFLRHVYRIAHER